MKILRITDSGYETGGVENGIVLLQPLLEKRGHIIKTLASDDRPDLVHFNDYEYKTLARFKKIFYSFNPYAYRALKKALREFQPDVVHIHTLGQASPAIFFPLKDYPTVLTVHGPEAFSKNLLLWCFPRSNFKHGRHEVGDLTFTGKLRYLYHRLIHSPLFALGFRQVDIIVTLSNYMHELMAQEGLLNRYVPNGTTLFAYHPLQKNALTNTLAYAGRLETYKGVDYLLKALPAILQKFPDTRLLIAGDGAEKEDLKELAAKLGLKNNTEFLGHLDRPRLEKLYQQSAVVVLPSVYPEAFGKVGIEAMSVGRPVVAARVGGISDWLVNGQTGVLVPPENSAALAEAIIRFFSDHSLLFEMGENARKKAQEFDLEKHAAEMEKIYKEAVKLHLQK